MGKRVGNGGSFGFRRVRVKSHYPHPTNPSPICMSLTSAQNNFTNTRHLQFFSRELSNSPADDVQTYGLTFGKISSAGCWLWSDTTSKTNMSSMAEPEIKGLSAMHLRTWPSSSDEGVKMRVLTTVVSLDVDIT
ncbi:hypothetical protein RUM43_007086 [Polyplax serrata]|uniref:Uncharacterized protein n=1 Tax=Polyplax serrata TaxID=468196 RepID=A0AAN8PLJ0_POLSC